MLFPLSLHCRWFRRCDTVRKTIWKFKMVHIWQFMIRMSCNNVKDAIHPAFSLFYTLLGATLCNNTAAGWWIKIFQHALSSRIHSCCNLANLDDTCNLRNYSASSVSWPEHCLFSAWKLQLFFLWYLSNLKAGTKEQLLKSKITSNAKLTLKKINHMQ